MSVLHGEQAAQVHGLPALFPRRDNFIPHTILNNRGTHIMATAAANFNLTELEMSLAELEFYGKGYIATRQSPHLMSRPGTGKTTFARTIWCQMIADHYGVDISEVGLVECELPTVIAPDLRGFLVPVPKDPGNPEAGYYSFYADPAMIQQVFATGKKYGLIIIDETSKGTLDTINGTATLKEDHQLAGHSLPEGWHVIFMGNYSEDRSGDMKMPGFHINRGPLIHVKTCIDALGAFCRREGIAEEYISMLEYMGADAFAQAVPKDQVQFATPRTVVGKAYDYLKAMLGNDMANWDIDKVRKGLSPIVGFEYAKGMADFYRFGKELPPLADIDRDPENCVIPEHKAALAILKGRLLDTMSEDNVGGRLIYMSRVSAGDIKATFVAAVKRGPFMLYINGPQGKAVRALPGIKKLLEIAEGKV